MGINYQTNKCPTCGSSSFNYIKETKMWECVYCGTLIEKHEQPDSLFAINNVVRMVLIDVSYRRFAEAKSNLNECEKIDSKYVGTTIANICYLLNAALFSNVTQPERANMIAQLKKHYAILTSRGEEPSEEEISLYESLDSAEAYGTLILALDTLNAQSRIEALYSFFKPEEVYSMPLNLNLLNYMIKHEKYELADRIVSNYENIDSKQALKLLLDSYPDTEQKAENCIKLISQNPLSYDERSVYENYLASSPDSFDTKHRIACAALKTDAYPSVASVMANLISKTKDSQKVEELFAGILLRKLGDSEVDTIVNYTLRGCSQEVALYILTWLKNSSQFVVFNLPCFIELLENKSFDYEYKRKLIDIALNFNVNDKTKEQFVSHFLNNVSDSFENRKAFLEYLFTLVPSISTASAEKYILTNSLDGEGKPEIVSMIFSLNLNKSFFRETLDKYILSGVDSQSVRDRIVEILSSQGLAVSENTCAGMLVNPSLTEQTKLQLLQRLKDGNIRYLSLLDRYLSGINPQSFSGGVLTALIEMCDRVSFENAAKYLLWIRDEQTSKPVTVQKLVSKCMMPVLSQTCRVQHLNNVIDCSVLQAYILISPDSPEVTCSVLNSVAQGTKPGGEIYVSRVGKKFKKYLSSVSASLSPSTRAAASMTGLL
ncbi:MAG: hypothetical protein IJL63_00815 [Clostridia bacterium]|nr:hypothetical protein [Clostridia bacterium]